MKILYLFFGLTSTLLYAQQNYVPDDPELFRTIVELDSILFDAYDNCDKKLDVHAEFYADELEFYHDKGGLMKSKKDVIEGIRKNICGKVTRILKPGSIEVYPIKDWGAIEIGMHRFRNNAEPNAPNHDSKFIIFWHNDNGQWKVTKVVSLH